MLLDAAEQVFMEKGVAASSLEEIASAAGVTRGALYWHFENKAALFDAMHERVRLPIEAMFERAINDVDPLGSLEELCIYCLRELGRDDHMRRVFTILMYKCEQTEMQAACAQRQCDRREMSIERNTIIFKLARKKGELKSSITPRQAATALHAYKIGLFSDYLRYPESYDMQNDAPKLIKAFFRGIRN